jgi:hypothetical protein
MSLVAVQNFVRRQFTAANWHALLNYQSSGNFLLSSPRQKLWQSLVFIVAAIALFFPQNSLLSWTLRGSHGSRASMSGENKR